MFGLLGFVSVYTTCIRRAPPILFWCLLMHALVVYKKKKKKNQEKKVNIFNIEFVVLLAYTHKKCQNNAERPPVMNLYNFGVSPFSSELSYRERYYESWKYSTF